MRGVLLTHRQTVLSIDTVHHAKRKTVRKESRDERQYGRYKERAREIASAKGPADRDNADTRYWN